MKYKKLKLTAVFLLCLSLTGLHAQENSNAAGGDATGAGGSASYTIGQVAYATHSGNNGSVTQGVQQTYIISSETGIDGLVFIKLSIAVYPNPASDYLQLQVDASALHSIKEMQYQLFNMQGKLLESRQLVSNKTQINMNSYKSATYFVRVISKNKIIKKFQIIKN